MLSVSKGGNKGRGRKKMRRRRSGGKSCRSKVLFFGSNCDIHLCFQLLHNNIAVILYG